jgi:hypothetical protein
MIPRSSTLALALFVWSGALFYPAQSQEQSAVQTPPDQPTYSFHTDTRVVLTDVTVTDANGNPVLNIVLIDIDNMQMADQMYLHYELTKFLNDRPEQQPLAIYLRAGSGCFLVQNFTSVR